MKFRLLILVVFLFGSIQTKAFCHPHVFINNASTFVFDDKGLSGFKMDWVFDEMFSNMIIHDYDKNKNGKFDNSEIEKIRKGAFANLKKFDYFTFVKVNGKSFKVRFVKDFSAKITKNRVVYHFFVPCHVRAAPFFKEIRISVYDKTFYCSVFLMKDQISFENGLSFEHRHRIVKNTKEAYYYGQISPLDIVLGFRSKDE